MSTPDCDQAEFELYPLRKPSDLTLQELSKTLWNWQDCSRCNNAGACTIDTCPWNRSIVLKEFYTFFELASSNYMPEEFFDDRFALRNYDDLLEVIRLIKTNPGTPRETIMADHLSAYVDAQPDNTDHKRAFDLAMRVMIMVQSAVQCPREVPWRRGYKPAVWRGDESVQAFVARTFPTGDALCLDDTQGWCIKNQLKAITLKSIHGMKFQGTDDLREHLSLHPETRVIRLYHHTSFLKECLIATKNVNDVADCDIIPRQLALETLDSVQQILFPLDNESRALLKNLVLKLNWDPDCVECDSFEYRRDNENDVQYHYWSGRLMNLFDESCKQKPQGKWWRWLDVRSKKAYLMAATIFSIMITTALGTGALSVGAIDASQVN